MAYGINATIRSRSHHGAYRVVRAAMLCMIALFALGFFVYAALSVASLFLWSLS